MAIKIKKDIVDITQELNKDLEIYGFQISFDSENKDDKKNKKDNNKKDKTTSKKK